MPIEARLSQGRVCRVCVTRWCAFRPRAVVPVRAEAETAAARRLDLLSHRRSWRSSWSR